MLESLYREVHHGNREVWVMKTFQGSISLFLFLLLVSACGSASTPVSPDMVPNATEGPVSSEVVHTSTPSAEPREQATETPTAPISENITPIPPLTTGDPLTITSIEMISGLTGWAVGGDQDPGDHILRTLDGGETWIDVTPPEPVESNIPARKVAVGSFINLDQALVLYYPHEFYGGEARVSVWWTDDGGSTWTRGDRDLRLEINESPPTVVYVEGQTGWIFVEGFVGMGHHFFYILRSQDNGSTWEVLAEPPDSVTGCHRTAITFIDEEHGWMTSECPFELADGVFLESTNDGGESWERLILPPPASSPNLFDQSSLCRTRSPNLLSQDQGMLVVTCYLLSGSTAEFTYATEDGGATWQAAGFPGGELSVNLGGSGWALGMELHKTVDYGSTWTFVKGVSWEGQFDFIDLDLGWAVARADEQIALVKTIDGGKTWMELKPVVGMSAVASAAEACMLSVSGDLTAYNRPSLQAEPFNDVPGGMSFYATARTSDGWIGFDPGYAQAANIGVFHHRWVQDTAVVILEGDCDAIPIVVGPPPGICFNMFMTDAPLVAEPLPGADVLSLIEAGDYAMVIGKSTDGWLRIDLSEGSVGMNINGWVESSNANFNGPCANLPLIEP
jgi:photosystem II stability/assembly factor-like uncharacterized protein